MKKTHLRFARKIAELLDHTFYLGPIPIGIDPIVGLIPWVGDWIGMLFSCYLLWIGWYMRIPRDKFYEMMKNIGIDLIIGLIPILGDIGDFFFHSNIKNIEILEECHKMNISEGEIIRE